MKVLYIIIFSVISYTAAAQKDTVVIPIDRQYFHDKIIKEQQQIDANDGKKDGKLSVSNNEVIDLQLAYALFNKVDALRFEIEKSSKISSRNEKVRFLNFIEDFLSKYRLAWQNRQIDPISLPAMLEEFTLIFKARQDNKSLLSFIKAAPYITAKINSEIFIGTKEDQQLRNIVYLKYIEQNPNEILQTIKPFLQQPFADSLITLSAQRTPTRLYSYAQSKYTAEGKFIHTVNDSTVQLISKLSQMPTALFYFPFMDDLLHKKKQIADIEKIVGDGGKNYDSVGYYKLLVATEIDYAKRLNARDTPLVMFGVNGLRDMLRKKTMQHFVGRINELHNSPTPYRMRAIQPLTAEELYYMIVMGESEIYTSSYKHSFTRLLTLKGNPFRGDSLLIDVHFDFFKKFIKMAANYNQLDVFLGSMTKDNAAVLMKAFVSNLDKGDNLEDAVDVADSYSSIVNKELRASMLANVTKNEANAIAESNSRGTVIYNLLKTVFLSADAENKIDLTALIGIPSIYEVDQSALKDSKGRIVQQVFFYGDEDGKAFYPPFVNSFSSADWIIKNEKEWVEIKSRKGDIYIYSNKPLDSDKNLDDSAQVHLNNYLKSQGMHPSIVVHRGHSYWLPGTIDRMPGDAKVVVLGSCGGYKNLNEILEISPDAHIISTKEVGAGDINRPILNYMNNTLKDGKALDWRTMWSALSSSFSTDPSKTIRESWEDYIPPYKNLGAIFLKAYNMKMGKL